MWKFKAAVDAIVCSRHRSQLSLPVTIFGGSCFQSFLDCVVTNSVMDTLLDFLHTEHIWGYLPYVKVH